MTLPASPLRQQEWIKMRLAIRMSGIVLAVSTALSAMLGPALAQDAGSDAEPAFQVAPSVLSRAQGRVTFEVLQGQDLNVELRLGRGCGAAIGLCVSGAGYIDFRVFGNRRIQARVRPDRFERINRRRLGVFDFEDRNARVPDIYYDVRIEFIDAFLGTEGFSAPNVVAPGTLSLAQYAASSDDWRTRTDLRTGAKLGRIYIQPLFESTETDIFAAPGAYTASIRLSIFER